jgi:hypothetical protein
MNIALLGAKHGEELGWVCLGLCGLDVTPFLLTSVNHQPID